MVEERRGRGLGRKPKMLCTSIRLPEHVMKYFSEAHKTGKQKAMRDVLVDYVDNQLRGVSDGNHTNN